MSSVRWVVLAGAMLWTGSAWGQDVVSGPEKDQKVPALKVFDATGPHQGKEVDYMTERKGKPTVYLFIQADKWDRPMAKFLRELENAIQKEAGDSFVVAVWLTDNVDKTKDYLPLAQQSLKFHLTALACFPGEKAGPKGWNVNADAHLTAVVANQGKVAATFGYQSINETNVPEVYKALQKANPKK
jgi:hypothetical protein